MRVGADVARFLAALYDVPGQAAWRVRIGARYLLTDGGIAPENGTIDLLEAHAAIVQEHAELADVRLVVAGAVPPTTGAAYLAAFTGLAAELGTNPLVLGTLADEDLPALVAGASAFGYLPTENASCASALEALAAGVPVVARDLPEVRAVLGDTVAYGDTLLSIADALVDVLTDPPAPDAGLALAASYAHRAADRSSAGSASGGAAAGRGPQADDGRPSLGGDSGDALGQS